MSRGYNIEQDRQGFQYVYKLTEADSKQMAIQINNKL